MRAIGGHDRQAAQEADIANASTTTRLRRLVVDRSARGAASRSSSTRQEAVFAQLVAQLIVAEAERAGGRPLIVAVSGQRILQELTLEGGDGLPEVHRAIRPWVYCAAFPPASSRLVVEAGPLMARGRRAKRRSERVELHLVIRRAGDPVR